MTYILIAGDIVPIKSNIEPYNSYNIGQQLYFKSRSART
jgi:hypothetical protein